MDDSKHDSDTRKPFLSFNFQSLLVLVGWIILIGVYFGSFRTSMTNVEKSIEQNQQKISKIEENLSYKTQYLEREISEIKNTRESISRLDVRVQKLEEFVPKIIRIELNTDSIKESLAEMKRAKNP